LDGVRTSDMRRCGVKGNSKATVMLKVKLGARKAGKVTVSFNVTSKNAGNKTVKKTIRVRK